MVTRKTRTIVRAARMLVDPDPVFVAHVRHGANQTPFRTLKADEVQPVAVAGRAKEAQPMTTKPKTEKRVRVRQAAPEAAPTARVEIASIFFPLEGFPTSEAVKSYLDTNGYAAGDAVIEPDAAGFVAKGHEPDAFEGELREIEHDGVTLTVGFLKADQTSKLASSSGMSDAEEAAAAAAEAAAQGKPVVEAAPVADEPAAAQAAADPEDEEEEEGEGEEASAAANDTPVQTAAPAADEPQQVAASAYEPAAEVKLTPEQAGEQLAAALAVAKEAVVTMTGLGVPGDTAKKFDNLLDVLNYFDDAPPGFYDLLNAFATVVRSAMPEKDYSKIKQAARDIADYMIALSELFAAPAAKTDEEEAPATDKGATLARSVDAILRDALSGNGGKPAKKQPAPAPEPEPAAVAAATADEPEVTDPVLKAVLALGSRIDALDQRIEQVAAAPAAKTAQPKPVATAAPARKGEGEGALEDTSSQPVKSHKYIDAVPDDRLYRDQLGLRRR